MSTIDYAIEYVDSGWSVLPVKPEEKRPYMTNWLQYMKTKATKDKVMDWFTKLSGAGIGIVTGKISNLVVLDIESYCTIPIETLLEKYPTQMVSRTGSGGYHLFYQYPVGVGNVSNRVGIFEGADLRADGGFIVLPPTVHPSGNQYEWIKRGIPGVFPKPFLDIQAKPTAQNENWIKEALRGVTEGSRNDTCARLAGYFFKKGMSADIVEVLLMEWNERNDPPMPVKEVRTVIKSIEKSHVGAGTQFTRVEYDDSTNGEEQSTFDVMKMSDYVKGYGGDGVSWLVNDWLPDKSITFIISPPESYKTWLLLDLAVSVATGTPFLGSFDVLQTGATLIIQQEDSHTGLTDRIALIMEQKLGVMPKLEGKSWEVPKMPDIPVYIHPSRQLRFDDGRVLAEMEKQIEIIKPKVILIDPLYSTTSGVDNYMADLANKMMVLKTWRDKYGCSFVIAHHSKKNLDPDSTAREDSWGSQFLNAFLEAGWQIRRNSRLAQNEIIVRRHSKVMGNLSPISLTFDISTKYPMKYVVSTRGYEPATKENGKSQPAQAYLLDLIKKNPVSQSEIMNQTGKTRSTVSRQIKQLESAGLVEKMPDGKWKAKEEQE